MNAVTGKNMGLAVLWYALFTVG